jgi:hypothetical protein
VASWTVRWSGLARDGARAGGPHRHRLPHGDRRRPRRTPTWSTLVHNRTHDGPIAPREEVIAVDQGPDVAVAIAVAIAVATELTTDVVNFLRIQNIPVGRLLVLRPPKGSADISVPDAAAANALAVGIRDAVRRACRTATRIHLFMATPMGLALMLGHRWNRLRPTSVYEDMTTEQLYEEAFRIDA